MNIIRLVPNLSNADDALRKFCRKNLKTPYSLEMVYLPFVLFRYRIEMTSLSGKRKTERGLFMADLIQGIPVNIRTATRLEVQEDMRPEFDGWLNLLDPGLHPKNRAAIGTFRAEEDKVMSAVLDTESAIRKGKRLLRYDVMRVAGGLRYRRIEIIPEPQTKTLHYPYWIVYYKNRKEKMTFAVLDGVTGEREKGAVERSIKLGMVRQHDPAFGAAISQGGHHQGV